jgi:hypothetical protein
MNTTTNQTTDQAKFDKRTSKTYNPLGPSCKIEGHQPGCGTRPEKRCPGASK